jgi:hypothetical protein
MCDATDSWESVVDGVVNDDDFEDDDDSPVPASKPSNTPQEVFARAASFLQRATYLSAGERTRAREVVLSGNVGVVKSMLEADKRGPAAVQSFLGDGTGGSTGACLCLPLLLLSPVLGCRVGISPTPTPSSLRAVSSGASTAAEPAKVIPPSVQQRLRELATASEGVNERRRSVGKRGRSSSFIATDVPPEVLQQSQHFVTTTAGKGQKARRSVGPVDVLATRTTVTTAKPPAAAPAPAATAAASTGASTAASAVRPAAPRPVQSAARPVQSAAGGDVAMGMGSGSSAGSTVSRGAAAAAAASVSERRASLNASLNDSVSSDTGRQQPRRWSVEEDDGLRHAVEKYGPKSWKLIATHVPGRSHVQCLQRWKKVRPPCALSCSCRAAMPSSRRAVLCCGRVVRYNVAVVCRAVRYPLRRASCGNDCARDRSCLTSVVAVCWLCQVLKPGLVKGHWTEREDLLLETLVASEPRNWGQVSQHIPGRTAKQCRERWCNHLDPRIKKCSWSADEDATLMEMYKRIGQKWAQISKVLPGRTENAVKIRWKTLSRTSHGGGGGGGGGGGKRGSGVRMRTPGGTASYVSGADGMRSDSDDDDDDDDGDGDGDGDGGDSDGKAKREAASVGSSAAASQQQQQQQQPPPQPMPRATVARGSAAATRRRASLGAPPRPSGRTSATVSAVSGASTGGRTSPAVRGGGDARSGDQQHLFYLQQQHQQQQQLQQQQQQQQQQLHEQHQHQLQQQQHAMAAAMHAQYAHMHSALMGGGVPDHGFGIMPAGGGDSAVMLPQCIVPDMGTRGFGFDGMSPGIVPFSDRFSPHFGCSPAVGLGPDLYDESPKAMTTQPAGAGAVATAPARAAMASTIAWMQQHGYAINAAAGHGFVAPFAGGGGGGDGAAGQAEFMDVHSHNFGVGFGGPLHHPGETQDLHNFLSGPHCEFEQELYFEPEPALFVSGVDGRVAEFTGVDA